MPIRPRVPLRRTVWTISTSLQKLFDCLTEDVFVPAAIQCFVQMRAVYGAIVGEFADQCHDGSFEPLTTPVSGIIGSSSQLGVELCVHPFPTFLLGFARGILLFECSFTFGRAGQK